MERRPARPLSRLHTSVRATQVRTSRPGFRLPTGPGHSRRGSHGPQSQEPNLGAREGPPQSRPTGSPSPGPAPRRHRLRPAPAPGGPAAPAPSRPRGASAAGRRSPGTLASPAPRRPGHHESRRVSAVRRPPPRQPQPAEREGEGTRGTRSRKRRQPGTRRLVSKEPGTQQREGRGAGRTRMRPGGSRGPGPSPRRLSRRGRG